MNAEKIENKIGKFIQDENDLEKAVNCYVRLKVEVNVNQLILARF